MIRNAFLGLLLADESVCVCVCVRVCVCVCHMCRQTKLKCEVAQLESLFNAEEKKYKQVGLYCGITMGPLKSSTNGSS